MLAAALSAIGTDTVAALTSALSALGGGAPTVRKDLTDEQRARADAILSAYDLQDAGEAIDEWVTGVAETFTFAAEAKTTPESRHRAFSDAPKKLDALADRPLDLVSLRRTLGDAPLAIVEEGQEHLADLLRMMGALLANVATIKKTQQQVRSTEAASCPTSLRELLYGDTLPLPIRRGLIAVGRSFAASFAIARAEEGMKRLQPWMALYLAETFRAGFAGVALAIARVAANDTTDLDNVRLSEAARKRLIEQWWTEPRERAAAAD